MGVKENQYHLELPICVVEDGKEVVGSDVVIVVVVVIAVVVVVINVVVTVASKWQLDINGDTSLSTLFGTKIGNEFPGEILIKFQNQFMYIYN